MSCAFAQADQCLSFLLSRLSMLLHLYLVHCANTPVQYTAIFHGCKNDKFQMKKVDNFLIFAQNIYTLRRF